MDQTEKWRFLLRIDREVFLFTDGPDIDNLKKLVDLLDILVKKYRTLVKDVFSAINHNTVYESDIAELMSFYNLLHKWSSIPRVNISIVYNTYLRLINGYTLSNEEIKQETEYLIPCAYDRSLISPRKDELSDLRDELMSWMDSTNSYVTSEIRELMMSEKIRKSNTVLTNGSKMDQIYDHDINDVMGQCFKPDNIDLDFVSTIGHYFDDKEFDYIPYRADHGITISFIPDSNMKIRIVYRPIGYVARFLKMVHKDIDKIARSIYGNSTYDQTGWIINLVNHGYNKNGFIISTDMSKYSDTLDLNLLLKILHWRYPDEVVDAIKRCFQMVAYDERHGTYYGNTENSLLLSSLQGLYSDFPLITIANLVIQDFVYYKLGMTSSDSVLSDRNSAVGDDTGMRFPSYTSEAMALITDCYNCVGVNINKEKTHTMLNGEGFIDFVKLKVSKDGIGWSFSGTGIMKYPRSVVKDDVFYRDICNLLRNLGRYEDTTYHDRMIDLIQNSEFEFLLRVSAINGGLKNSPIDEGDIKLFMFRFFNMHNWNSTSVPSLSPEFINTTRNIEWMQSKIDLSRTPLRLLLPRDVTPSSDDVKLEYLNLSKIGFLNIDEVEKIDLKSLIGIRPSTIFDKLKSDNRNRIPLTITEQFIVSYPLVPSFGKLKVYNVYQKLRDMLTHYSFSGFDLGFRFYTSGFRKVLSLDDFKSSFRSRDVLWSKIRELCINYYSMNGNLIERCVFGDYFYYAIIDNHQYIIGNHPYSTYQRLRDEDIAKVLAYYGYEDSIQ